MKFVYLKRSYLFNKATKKAAIPKHYIYPLYTISLIQPARWTQLYNLLLKVNRHLARNTFTDYLNYLVENGYINKDRNKFSLTAKGTATLQDVERRLRIERYDR